MADTDTLKKETQSLLSSLIISSATGLTVHRLRKDYQDEIGADVPYKKLGFLTFDQFLKSIPETCRLDGSGDNATVLPIVTNKTKHINDMIMKQRPPKSRSNHKHCKRNRGVYANNIQPKLVKPQYNLPMIRPPCNPNYNTKMLPPPADYYDKRRKNFYNVPPRMMKLNDNHSASNSPRLPNKQSEASSCVEVKSFSNDNSNHTASTSYYDPFRMSNKQFDTNSDEMKSNNSVTYNNLISNSRYTNQVLHTSDNYAYINDMYGESNDQWNISYDDDFESEFSYQSDNEEQDLANCSVELLQITPKENESNLEEITESRVTDKVKEKLRILISEHPDGIWCSKLVKLYNEKFKQKLDPLVYGFSSVIQLCDDVRDVFHCIRPNKTDWKLFDKRKPLPEIHTTEEFSKYLLTLPVETPCTNTEPALPENYVQIPHFQYPEGVLHPEEEIPRQWLANNKKENDYIEVIVAEVYDPSKFWIQLRGPDTSIALSSLMDDMQLFYANNGNLLRLSLLSTRIGLYCAALYMNEYHRAVIIKIYDDETMKVIYIDYGTIAEVQLRQTCFLNHRFARLPAQAIRARLANIIPKDQNTMWSREATRCMMSLIMDKDLIAFISSINFEQQILDLIVTDTSLPNVDIHINDVLINESYAVLGKEAPICATSSATVSNVHLFPTFDEIETSVYPTISDVLRLLKLGQTYEQIFHGYFMPTADNTITTFSPTFNYNARCSTSHEPAFTSNSECTNDPEYINYIDTEREIINSINETSDISNDTNNIHIDSICQDSEDIDNITQAEIFDEGTTSLVLEKGQECISKEARFESVEGISSNLQFSEQISESHKLDNNNEKITKGKLELRETEVKINVNVKKPPPGFENVQPVIDADKNILLKLFQGSNLQSSLPVQPPAGLLGSGPLDYSFCSQLSFGYSSNLFNGIGVYNNYILNQYLLQKQQEEYYRTVMQQYSILENARLVALQKQVHHPQNIKTSLDKNDTTSVPSTFSDLMKYEEASKQVNDTHYYNSEKENLSTGYTFENTSTDSCNMHKGLKYNDKISFQTGRNYDRFVIEFKINGNVIHILNIDDELYVVSQEILTNLLKSNLSLKAWLTANELDMKKFPNKLVNIMNYEHVYNQMKSFSIPGVYSPNNLGCNIRVTLLTDVVKIIKKYGDQTTLRDLSAEIEYVRSPEMWKSLNSTD